MSQVKIAQDEYSCDEQDLESSTEGLVRKGFVLLLTLVEESNREDTEMRAESQRLLDEINRLKGDQGKPRVKRNTPKSPSNYSSEKERRSPKGWTKGEKTTRIVIDREPTLEVDRATPPPVQKAPADFLDPFSAHYRDLLAYR